MMRKEALGIILTADMSGKARGRAFSRDEFDDYAVKGCGWVPANLAIDTFGRIVTPNPFGSVGDLRLMPDVSSRVEVPIGADGEFVSCVMADLHTMEGKPWACDPRTFLKQAVSDLEVEAGLTVLSSFEHEFMLADEDSSPVNFPFSLEAFLDEEELGGKVFAALKDGGLEPEMWLPEFGRDQFEITLQPADALTAADRAIYLREVVRHVAHRLDKKITFSPLVEEDGGGNGVHVHLSLWDMDSKPVTYDSTRPGHLSEVAGSFAAGILKHAEAIQAVAAPSPLSYERLMPHRWSVGGIFLGENNREALLRVCPLFAPELAKHPKQHNLEYRATDATANPWLVLGLLIRAGLDGIRAGLTAPDVVRGETSGLTESQQRELGIRRLPTDLNEALSAFSSSEVIRQWFSPELIETFEAVKRAEIAYVAGLTGEEKYQAYSATY